VDAVVVDVGEVVVVAEVGDGICDRRLTGLLSCPPIGTSTVSSKVVSGGVKLAWVTQRVPYTVRDPLFISTTAW
jgi:hypothetical protein